MMKSTLAALAVLTFAAAPSLAGDCGSKTTTTAAAAPAMFQGAMLINASHHPTMAKADIVDTAIGAGSFTTLVAAVQAAGLEGALRGPGPFTVFAPTDAAFAALPAGTVESLLKPENKQQLVDILTYHVVSGAVRAEDLAGKQLSSATLNANATLSIDATTGVKVNGANVISANVEAGNGVIHVIDAVLLPPAAN
jgi:uncharacterized surface protein with fasciclin (FAS1) repeats